MSVSRGLLTQALEDIGVWRVETQNSAQGAFSQLQVSPSHLVLCDYNMPGMNGLQLLRALRQNDATKKIAFILVTGSPSAEIIETGKKLGMNNLIRKPFTNDKMKAAIEQVVGRLG